MPEFTPYSRNEYLLNEIRKNTEGGGGGSGSGLPDVTDADNNKILIVNYGKWIVAKADNLIDSNSSKPIANSAVYTELETLRAEIYDIQPIIRAGDATAKLALEQMSGDTIALVTPADIKDAKLLFSYFTTSYLLWTNGTKLDSGKVLIEIDMTNNAITMYARGKSSMVSGVMGVDTSWTVTSL